MAKEFQTIFTNLSNVFYGAGGRGGQPAPADIRPDRKEILHASSQEEMKAKTLQVQQDRFLKSQYLRQIKSEGDKKMMYESNRLAQYIDYQSMEYYPIISAALDLLAEEATTVGQDGKMMKIYSSNKRVKKALEDLFYKTLDINSTLQFWVRNTVKYGDNFLYLLLDQNLGVIGAKQLANIEVERVEEIVDDKLIVKFKYKGASGSLDEEYTTWQVAHFRLLGDDRRMPYGMSVLDKVRRTFKMLTLFEDSMMVYRITRAAERRIFKVDVGDMPEEDVDQFIQQVARSAKSTKLVDPNTGDFNWKYNVATNDQDYFVPVRSPSASSPIETLSGACLSLDTRIPLLDGRTLPLNEIIDEHDAGKSLWIYSINQATGEIVPGPVTWAGVTRKDTAVLKITLDNGEEMIVTPDHKFPTRTGLIKEAQDLVVGESLFSFEKKFAPINKSENNYEMVYDHAKQKFVYTHRMVANYLPKQEMAFNQEFLDSDKGTIHHLDYNRFNNNPSNLVFMNTRDHMQLHQSVVKENAMKAWLEKYHNNDDFKSSVLSRLDEIRTKYYSKRSDEKAADHREKQIAGILNHYANLSGEAKEKHRQTCAKNIVKGPANRDKRFIADPAFKADALRRAGVTQKITKATQEWKDKNKHPNYVYSQELLKIVVDFARAGYENQVELVKVLADNNGDFMRIFYEINKTNPLFKKTFKCLTPVLFRRMMKSFGYTGLRDLHAKLPMYNHRITSIEYLEEPRDTGTITVDGQELYHNHHNFALASGVFTQNSNLDQIADLSYLRDNLYTGLGIPKAFLGFSDDSGGEGKALSMLDIRFARKVNKIQQSMISELNKIAMIHLYILGDDFREHLDDFTITLANPSTASHMLKIETQTAMFTAYEAATRVSENGTKPWSEIRAKKDILGMSEEEIMDDLQEQMIEAKIGDEIKASGQLIRSSGLFDKLIKYKNAGFLTPATNDGGAGGDEAGGDPMGGGGDAMMGGGAPPDPLAGGGGDPMADLGGGGPPPPGAPMNETQVAKPNRGKQLAKGLIKILKESELSDNLGLLMNSKESRLINESVKMEETLNRLISELDEK